MVPHTVDVTRFLTYSHISLDGYSGDYSALRIGLSNESTDMESSPDEFYLGAASVFHSPAEDFQGECVVHWHLQYLLQLPCVKCLRMHSWILLE